MDSGNNSASLQSSSTGGAVGGDEEYDSRADSFSSAFHTQNSSMFDPFANYFNPIYRPQPPPPPPPSHNYTVNPNSVFNLDNDWNVKRMRSDQTNNPMLLPSSDDKSSPNYFNNCLSFGTTTAGSISFPSSSPEEHRGGGGGGNLNVTTSIEQPAAAADQPTTQPARNPKKRSRASRRAPTTVLTTDTTNFRAMVQEFTGIPAPPFASPSYFPHRNRFDLFASARNSAIRSASAAPSPAAPNNNPFNISQLPPNYLRRPFPQKIHPPTPPFLSPPPSSSALMLNRLPNNITSASSTTTSPTNSAINYQQLVSNSVAQSSNHFNTIQQNSILSSLLQSPQKYPIGLKEQQLFQMPTNSNSQFQMPSIMNSSAQHGHLLSGLPNLISQEQAAPASRNNNTINAANFHGDKVQETVATKGGTEGMVESWICSSD